MNKWKEGMLDKSVVAKLKERARLKVKSQLI